MGQLDKKPALYPKGLLYFPWQLNILLQRNEDPTITNKFLL